MRYVFLVIILVFNFSCEYNNLEIFPYEKNKINYSIDIVPILSTHCTLNGCHVNGASIGDFTVNIQLKDKIVSGKFQRMVFDLKLMPPLMNVRLTEKELETLQEWVNAGAEF